MKYCIVTLWVLVGLSAVGCRSKDVREVEIHVVGMETAADAMRVRDKLVATRLLGVDDIKVDQQSGTVTITYDSMKLAVKNMEYAIAELGYDTYSVTSDGAVRDGVPASAVLGKTAPPAPKTARPVRAPATGGPPAPAALPTPVAVGVPVPRPAAVTPVVPVTPVPSVSNQAPVKAP